MKFNKQKRRTRGGVVPAVSQADLFFGSGRHDSKPDYHTQALCKQVLRTLTFILSGEVADAEIQALTVMEVHPAPNAGRLAVVLASRGRCTLTEVLPRLEALQGFIRTRVAESITRKRAPELTFIVVPMGALAVEEGEAGRD
jgi:ribosome-binding factor A